MKTCRLCGRTASCGCAFNSQGICKICSARAQGAKDEAVPLDIRMELQNPPSTPMKPSPPHNPATVVHFSYNSQSECNLVARYARDFGCVYRREDIQGDIFKTADAVKRAALVVIWSGYQWASPLAVRLCRRRGIPLVFIEQGMLPQRETFFVDPGGFCGESVLNGDLAWVEAKDVAALQLKREQLALKHPRRDEGFVLVPLQIENDSQVLYHSPYNTMHELVQHVEAMYPAQRIVVRPHPGGDRSRKFARAESILEGEFLDWASRASVVVGITSTCLYEAAILGVPVVALGDHPLKTHPSHRHDRVAAGALSLCIRRDGDLAPVLERFGIRPLADRSLKTRAFVGDSGIFAANATDAA